MNAHDSQTSAVTTPAPRNLAERLAAHLPTDCMAELIDAFETQGFCVIPELLDSATLLPERVRELLGYSIHPPFMGYSDGVHPGRLLP